jgi:hypothetical protein
MSGRRVTLKQIDGLVDEYMENKKFVEDNNLTVKDLPTKEDIREYFQDPPENDKIEVEDGIFERCFEVDVDTICLEDKLALEVFKWVYRWKWTQGSTIPPEIHELIKINNIISKSNNKDNRDRAKARLANICIVGIIRFYGLERTPYLCPTQIIKSLDFLRQSLGFLSSVIKGKYKQKVVNGELYIFDPFDTNEGEINGS